MQKEQQEQIVGTQAFGASYHFTKDDLVIEQAKRIKEMGSKMIKIKVDEQNSKVFDEVLKMGFSTYFLWWRGTNSNKKMSPAEKTAEGEATYEFTKYLLTKHAKDKKTFFLGHWEGDWLLIDDVTKDAPKTRIDEMIEWLDVRQNAVDKARTEFGGKNSSSKVYHYTEVNRVREAMGERGLKRLVNTVLPETNVDYVSYSSYDVQTKSQEVIDSTIEYIKKHLKPKAGIDGERVFIGEFGIPADSVGYNIFEHEKKKPRDTY